jgi:TonB family protein
MGSTATDSFLLTAEADGALDRSLSAADDRRFFRFLLIAILLHALLLVRINTGEPRRLGAPGGADDAISVSLVTERDLNGTATVEDTAPGLPQSSPPPAETKAPPRPQDTPPPVEQPKPAEPEAAAPAPPPPAPAEEPPEQSQEKTAALRPTLPDEAAGPAPKQADAKAASKTTEAKKETEAATKEKELTEDTKLLDLTEAVKQPKKAETPKEAKPKPAPEPAPAKKTQTAKLDLTPPAMFQAPVGGGGAGVQRPAGITRSGENDDFARGVIRALQRTMPQLRNTFGRVTVRIELNMNGNLVRTTVLVPSKVAGLDQNVVFATQQSSFPFPPRNAVPADLVFFVTYIYR